MVLSKVNSPEDLKGLKKKELEQLSKEIREFLIENVSKTGGHLGSNLGIVELTIALHKMFDSPKDKIIFDVGHQCYVHKILTGRKVRFETLRQYQGMSGFIKFDESIHDVWEAGHSSTSIAGAMGYAIANKLDGNDNKTICIIGDGSLTNGMALEGLNHLSETQSNVIIILNDNEMSISSNIGFVDKILNDLQHNNEYVDTKVKVKNKLNKSKTGSSLAKVISVVKNKIKHEMKNDASNFFNLMGINYFGPVDGHNFKSLESALANAAKIEGPVIIHVKTKKGKGYEFAEKEKWHGVGPFNIETGKPLSEKKGYTYSSFVSESIIKKMESDDDIVVITPAMLDGSELKKIQELYPKRIFDVGIAEEHGITLAASLAIAGKKPFVSIYSTFLQRAYDQVFHDIVRQNANVVIGIDRAGLVGQDGETHQGIYDISFLSHMHNLIIVQGNNSKTIKGLLDFAFDFDGPIAIRYPRGGSFTDADLEIEKVKIELGKWLYSDKNSKLSIIAYGDMYNSVKVILDELGYEDINLINAIFIKPIDEECLLKIKDSKLLVVEEHTANGSLATQIISYYNEQNINIKVETQNLGDRFIEQGDIASLYKETNLDSASLKEKILNLYNEESL